MEEEKKVEGDEKVMEKVKVEEKKRGVRKAKGGGWGMK